LRQTGDIDGLGLSYVYLGVVALRRGEYPQAMGLLEQSLLSFRDVGDTRRVSIALRLMGEVELCQGHYTPATTLLDESLTLVREANDRVDLGLTVYLLGQAARAAENFPRAKELFEESLALAREFNDTLSAGLALTELATLARQQGEVLVAIAFVEESLRTLDPREKFGIVACLHALAMVASQEGEAERAAIIFGASHKLREEIGAPIPPFERDEYDLSAGRVQAQLGEDEFARLLAEGRSLTVDAAIAYASQKSPSTTAKPTLAGEGSVASLDRFPSPSGGGQGGGSGWH
jgi:tetratricopeptide (TPR) repeat protein